MGFNVKKAVEAEKDMEIRIPLSVNISYENESIDEKEPKADPSEEVFHIMRLPVTKEREKHQQMMVKVRGQNVKALGASEANFWLWKQCMIRLEGYDELPSTKEQIIKMFEDSTILHIQAESAAAALLNHISAIEGDISKK